MGSRSRTLACALLVAAAAVAQERQQAFGRVVDAGGAGAPGARVTLFWTPAGDALGERTDRVDAVADGRGRFVAALLPRVGYSAFALGAAGADGRCPASDVAESVAAGNEIELRLSATAGTRRATVRIGGDSREPREGAALRVQVFVPARNALGVDAPLDGATAIVPHLPDGGTVLIRDERGAPLWVAPAAREPEFAVEVPPARTFRFRAVDEKGQPLAGVAIEQQLAPVAVPARRSTLDCLVLPAARPIATTDANGEAIAAVHAPAGVGTKGNRDSVLFAARGAGRGLALAGFDNGWFQGAAAIAAPADDRLELVLSPAARLQLRWQGAPIAGLGVTFSWRRNIRSASGSSGRIAISRAVADANGHLDVPVVADCTEAVVIPDPLPLPGSGRVAIAMFDADPTAGDRVVDLASFRHLRVQLRDDTGGPAVGVPLAVLGLQRMPYLFATRPAFTDRAGRADLLVGAGGWLCFASDGERAAWHAVAADVSGAQEVPLVHARAPRLRVRLVDGDGAPVAGASISHYGMPEGPAGRPEDTVLGHLARTFPVQRAWVSGTDGVLEVPVLRGGDAPWTVEFGCGSRRSERMQLVPDADRVDVVVR